MTYGSPAFIQDGALAALTDELPEVAALREDYRRRAALMSDLLREAPGCRVVPPEGGMFVLLDVRGTGLDCRRVSPPGCSTPRGSRSCRATVSAPSAAGHLRIALCAPEARLGEAGERIVRFARSSGAAQRNARCGRAWRRDRGLPK